MRSAITTNSVLLSENAFISPHQTGVVATSGDEDPVLAPHVGGQAPHALPGAPGQGVDEGGVPLARLRVQDGDGVDLHLAERVAAEHDDMGGVELQKEENICFSLH